MAGESIQSRTDRNVFLAVDRSGGPTNNNIYMLASVVPPGRSTTDVMFVRSTDGGVTFSAPVKVNDDPVNPSKWHWFGTFAVAPNGRLDAVWHDTRNAANNTDSQLFYSWSTDGGVTWAPNVAVSNPFNPFEGYPNQNKIGDYITIVSDETGGNVAYSATFNFNPQQKPARRRRLLRSGIPWWTGTHADANANRVTECNTNADKHTDTYRHTNADCYCYSDGYGNTHNYSTANADAEECSDAERTSDSAAEAVRRRDQRSD